MSVEDEFNLCLNMITRELRGLYIDSHMPGLEALDLRRISIDLSDMYDMDRKEIEITSDENIERKDPEKGLLSELILRMCCSFPHYEKMLKIDNTYCECVESGIKTVLIRMINNDIY